MGDGPLELFDIYRDGNLSPFCGETELYAFALGCWIRMINDRLKHANHAAVLGLYTQKTTFQVTQVNKVIA